MKISSATMVGDNPDLLKQMLKSLRPHVDEIVVNVTSPDLGAMPGQRVWRVAKKYADKVVHRPWRKDMALARNQALEHCTGDWALLIDSDEELECVSDLRAELELVPDDIVLLLSPTVNYKGGAMCDTQVNTRAVRPGQICMRGRVHHQATWLIPCQDQLKAAIFPAMSFRHLGYDGSQVDIAAKVALRKELIQELLDEGNPMGHFYMAQTYGMAGDHEAALKEALRYITKRPAKAGLFDRGIWYSAITAALRLNRTEVVERLMALAEKDPEWRESPDYHFCRAEMFSMQHKGEQAAKASLEHLVAVDNYGAAPMSNLFAVFTLAPINVAVSLMRVAGTKLGLGAHCLDRLAEMGSKGSIPGPAYAAMSMAITDTMAGLGLTPAIKDLLEANRNVMDPTNYLEPAPYGKFSADDAPVAAAPVAQTLQEELDSTFGQVARG